MRNRNVGFCAMLVVLALASPGEARAEDEDRSNDAQYAMTCAIEYAGYAELAPADSGFLERQMALMDRFDLDHEVVALRSVAGMARLGVLSGDIPVEWLVNTLAECDRAFGFSPITKLIDSKPGLNQTEIADFDCAVAYWLLGAFVVNQRQAALQRSEFATGLYHLDNPLEEPAAVGQQVIAAAQARGQQLQRDQESGETLSNDINACEVKYGFAQAGGQ